MRFAKLEQNIIVAFFITQFEYELCDRQGNAVRTPTPIYLNAFSACKPEPSVYVRYRQRGPERRRVVEDEADCCA